MLAGRHGVKLQLFCMDACKQGSRRIIRLPRSQKGQGLSFITLIQRICPRRTLGNVFEGRRLRPGARVREADLKPTPDYPDTPLLLEYAGSDRSGSGHKRSSHTYILWRFEPSEGKWLELVRVEAEALEWIETIRPVALRNFTSRALDLTPILRAGEAASRVLIVLEAELEVMDIADRAVFLGYLYEQFTARLVRDGVDSAGCDSAGAELSRPVTAEPLSGVL